MDFLRIVFACNVLEGYGSTECTAACTLTLPSDCTTGHVGAPLPTAEIKLAPVPEMGYGPDDEQGPRGEVCVRGPTVFKGYYKDDANTKIAFEDGDDWLHTGDIGKWRPDGTLQIIDRKKNIFKLQQGEYVAPEKVEGVYNLNAFVAQSFCHGDSLQASTVAVIVPDRDALLEWSAQNGDNAGPGEGSIPLSSVGVGGTSAADDHFAEVCRRPATVEFLLENLRKHSKDQGLKGFEIARKIHVCPEEFSVDQGLLTPTFKLKRTQLKAYFEAEITAMYA